MSEYGETDNAMDVDEVQPTGASRRSGSVSSRMSDESMHHFGVDEQSETNSVVSFPAFSQADTSLSSNTSYTHAPSLAPWTESDSSEGTPPSTVVVELSEEMRAAMYKQEFGRSLNSYSDVYRLPVDEEELGRLKKQHDMLDQITVKYPPEILHALTSDTPGEKAVIDLGCGNGDWIKEIARAFPNCDAVAVDLVPMGDATDKPPNLRCEIDDINLGLEHFFGQFDVVHCRLIAAGISNYQNLIEHIARVLRPGGVIELGESDCHVYDGNYNRVLATADEIGPPWWPRWMAFFRMSIQHVGGNVSAATHILDWVRDHEAFENIHFEDVWLPVVPGPRDDHNDPIFSTMKDDVLTFIRSGRPTILGRGVSEEDLDTLEDNAVRELHELDIPIFSRFQRVWATRTNANLGPLPGG